MGSEIARRLGEEIGALVDAAVPIVACLVRAIAEILQIAFQVFVEVCFNGSLEGRLIVLRGNDAVAATVNDLFDNIFLAVRSICLGVALSSARGNQR